MVKIFIDAGHGGNDGGASSNGLLEKNLNLSIARIIQEKLSLYNNVQVKMSRQIDIYLSLAQRTNMANSWGADAFVSVHINASANTSARGFETYIYPNVGARTSNLQNDIHSEIMKETKKYGVNDRGTRRADFHVLRESSMDAILTENLFVTNSADAGLLKRSDFLNDLAEGHVNGLARFFGLKKKVTSQPTKSHRPVNVEYKVQIGAFENKNFADNLAKKAVSDGYKVFVHKEGKFHFVQIGAFSEYKNAKALEEKAKKDGYSAFIKPD